jgi:hypothetical protein
MIDDFQIFDGPYLDLSVIQDNIEACDTIGMFTPPIQIYNGGNVSMPAGSSVDVTYVVNGGTPVVETLTLPTTLGLGDTTTLVFTTPYDFNTFTAYNATLAVNVPGDADPTNDTVDFVVSFHGFPVVNLGADTILCADASILLDAGNPGATYNWWNSNTTSTVTLDSSYCGGIGTCSFWVDVDNTYGCVTRDTINITWSACAGISEMNNPLMTIMPNPSNGVFTVDFGGLTGTTNVDIYDLTGNIVISETLELTGVEKHNYDLSSYSKGIYNIRIVNSNQVAVRKIVVN